MSCTVETCCCGCSLKTGSYLIGLIQAVLSGLLLALYIVSIVGFAYNVSVDVNDPKTSEEDPEVFRNIEKLIIAVTSIMALLVAIHMWFGFVLAYAAKKEMVDLLQIWIMYSIVYIVLVDILNLINCVSSFVYGQTTSGTQSLLIIIAVTALQSYFIVVVKSYYEVLTQGRQPIP